MFYGQYIGTDVFGLGTKMHVVSNDYECYILDWSVKEMSTIDKAKVTKMKKMDGTTKEAAKEFLISEQKRPVEDAKQDIKACFQAQLHKHDFKQFKTTSEHGFFRWGEGITYDLLEEVKGALHQTVDIVLEGRAQDV